MEPDQQCCHNPDCSLRGQVGQGNIHSQSRKERRYRCTRCGRTFAASSGTPYYRLHHAAELLTRPGGTRLTLLCHGCPIQAIVAAFGLDERTVARWQRRAGDHCRQVHEHRVEAGRGRRVPTATWSPWVPWRWATFKPTNSGSSWWGSASGKR